MMVAFSQPVIRQKPLRSSRQRLSFCLFVLLSKSLTLPVPPGTPLSPRAAAASMRAVGVCSAAVPAVPAVRCSALSIGAAVPRRCGVWSSGNRLVPGHSCRLLS